MRFLKFDLILGNKLYMFTFFQWVQVGSLFKLLPCKVINPRNHNPSILIEEELRGSERVDFLNYDIKCRQLVNAACFGKKVFRSTPLARWTQYCKVLPRIYTRTPFQVPLMEGTDNSLMNYWTQCLQSIIRFHLVGDKLTGEKSSLPNQIKPLRNNLMLAH